LDLYRALRTVNPSPYMFLLDTGDFALVGASPEVHVRLTDGCVEIRPIAGTRRRGASAAEDLALEKELLADEKERAEHLMLVDLARNDIGRVCSFGSVTVPEFMIVERYPTSCILSRRSKGASRPTRTPSTDARNVSRRHGKRRAENPAMQIIAEQEKLQRGFYAGALGYFSYDGNLDSCITLRTALVKDGRSSSKRGRRGGRLGSRRRIPGEHQQASALLKAVAIAEKL